MTANHEPSAHHLTTDNWTIREWAEEADAEPVQSVDGTRELAFVQAGEHGAENEHVEWDEFLAALEREDKVVATYGAGRMRTLQVLDRDEATVYAADSLVERASIVSELVDRTTVSETVVGAELSSRDLGECRVEGLEDHRTLRDDELFEVGHETTEDFDVTVQAKEVWTVTKEVVEQAAIESRVVDGDDDPGAEVESDADGPEPVESEADGPDPVESDAVGPDPVEADTAASRVDVGDVEATILESGILESSANDAATTDDVLFRSEFVDDDVILTEFVERKTVEQRVSVEREFSGSIDAAETRSVHDGATKTVDGEIASAKEYEFDELDATDYDQTGRTGEPSASSFMIDESAQGKTVVDQAGDAVGIVSEVKSGTLYVDPRPSLTDKIRSKLGWGDVAEDSYPLREDRIDDISETTVSIQESR